jgi:hypothetical protein
LHIPPSAHEKNDWNEFVGRFERLPIFVQELEKLHGVSNMEHAMVDVVARQIRSPSEEGNGFAEKGNSLIEAITQDY